MTVGTLPIAEEVDDFSVTGAAYDWQIAGMKFASAVDSDSPMERAFARVTKEAIDQSPQPGDQSLDGWWVRSQTDWTGGAGYTFMEPMSEPPIPSTFNWSYGVDVWQEGKLTLHRKPRAVLRSTAVTSPNTTASIVAYSDYVYFSVADGVFRFPKVDIFDDGFSVDTYPAAYATLPSDITKLLVAAGNLLAFTLSNGVYKINGDGTVTQLFTSSSGVIDGWWAKDRLILASGASLYEEPIPSGSVVALNAQTPLVTSQDAGWKWVSVSDSPGAILVAGSGEGSSTISAIRVESDGGLPVLSAPAVVAEMPLGERIRYMKSYLGAYLLIATTAGVRVATIGGDPVTYGPLLGCPVTNGEFAAYDRFAYAPVTDAGEGRPGLLRFDLSQVTSEGKVPWANDVRVDLGVGGVIATAVLGTNTQALLAQNTKNGSVSLWASTATGGSEDYGVLQSGAIRMGSTVPKNWARVGLMATPPMRGQIKAELITQADTYEVGSLSNPDYEVDWRIAEYGVTTGAAALRLVLSKADIIPPDEVVPPPEPDPIPTPTPGPAPEEGEHSWNTLRALTWLRVKDSYSQWEDIADSREIPFGTASIGINSTSTTSTSSLGIASTETTDGLNPADVAPSDAAETPVLESWIIKAVPAIERTELMRIPLSCFDWEIDSRGQKIGGSGTALSRYEELTTRVGAGTIVDLRNLNTERTFKVVVDDLSFRQSAPGSRGSGFGGVVDLVVRVLA